MSDPPVTVAEAFKQFSQVTVAAVRRDCDFRPPPPTHSLQLRAYEHGTRARLNQAEDDLRVLRHERDDSLRDLNAFKEQNRAWVVDVNRWKAEARVPPALPCAICLPPPSSMLPTASLQADSALLVVKIAHPIELFWESPKLTSSSPPFSPHTQHRRIRTRPN